MILQNISNSQCVLPTSLSHLVDKKMLKLCLTRVRARMDGPNSENFGHYESGCSTNGQRWFDRSDRLLSSDPTLSCKPEHSSVLYCIVCIEILEMRSLDRNSI